MYPSCKICLLLAFRQIKTQLSLCRYSIPHKTDGVKRHYRHFFRHSDRHAPVSQGESRVIHRAYQRPQPRRRTRALPGRRSRALCRCRKGRTRVRPQRHESDHRPELHHYAPRCGRHRVPAERPALSFRSFHRATRRRQHQNTIRFQTYAGFSGRKQSVWRMRSRFSFQRHAEQ